MEGGQLMGPVVPSPADAGPIETYRDTVAAEYDRAYYQAISDGEEVRDAQWAGRRAIIRWARETMVAL
jgi:hypothetical protein